jgi:hypothetical protein
VAPIAGSPLLGSTPICAHRTAGIDVKPAVADRGLGRLSWAESCPSAPSEEMTAQTHELAFNFAVRAH